MARTTFKKVLKIIIENILVKYSKNNKIENLVISNNKPNSLIGKINSTNKKY